MRSARVERRGGRCAMAMTLVELLVVILIIAAVLAIAVPSFSSLMYSSESTLAESMVQASMRGGRDAALRSGSREDGAVMFSYEPAPGGGRLVMTPCVKVADFFDFAPTATTTTLREVFVPSAVVEPVQLPKNWVVRGYAPANSIETTGQWYEGNRYGTNLRRGDWVFPETGFYTPGAIMEGRYRQTFMVRFEAGTGVMAAPTAVPAYFFSPSRVDPPGFAGLNGTEVAELRALRLANPRRYVERVVNAHTLTPLQKRNLMGFDSPDIVSVRSVSALALYDETKMAAGLRARLDPDTGCMYKKHVNGQNPTFVPVSNAAGQQIDDDAQTSALMNQWIEGDTNLTDGIRSRTDPDPRRRDEPEARLFTVDRYSGTLKRVETQR